jgi:hypothetical protein
MAKLECQSLELMQTFPFMMEIFPESVSGAPGLSFVQDCNGDSDGLSPSEHSLTL